MSIGIDIGVKTIKVIETVGQGNKAVLKSAGAVGYQGNSVDKITSDKEKADFASLIKKLLADAKITGKKVNISLPETSVFSRMMKFPLLSDEEIESAIKWEAEEFIPFSLTDAVMRHAILERQETGNPPQVLVQVVAVAKSLVSKYVSVLESAGLEVNTVETELSSLARVFGKETDEVTLIVELGAHATNIGIVKADQLFLSRSVSSGGDAFSRAISLSLGVSVLQADQYKASYGLEKKQLDGKVGQSIIPVLRIIADEIKKTIHYFQQEARGQAPSSVILTGGSAGLPGLSAALTEMSGLEVSVGNPFTNGKIVVDESSLNSLKNFAPLYAVSCGLALRED